MVQEGCNSKMVAVILEILNQMSLMEMGSIVLLTRKKMASHPSKSIKDLLKTEKCMEWA